MKHFKATLIYVLMAAAAAIAGPAQRLIAALPQSTSHLRVRTPLAAVCADGSTWLVWWQGIQFGEYALTTSLGDELGMFCRLVSREGRDLVSPRRIVAPRDITSAGPDLEPNPFYLTTTPDGNAVLFAHAKATAPRGRQTLVLVVDRRGGVHEGRLDFRVASGPLHVQGVWQSSQGRTWSYGGRKGEINCLFGGVKDDAGHLLRLKIPAGHDWLSRPETRRFSSRQSGASSEAQYRPLGWMTSRGAIYSAVAAAGPDTLVVAFCPPKGETDFKFGARHPGDTMVVYRYHTRDLELIDSTIASCGSVAGWDFLEATLPHAVLAKTDSGYAFNLQRPGRISSYLLGLDGGPRIGGRDFGRAGASGKRAVGKPELVSFGKQHNRPWVVDWFGFADNGMLLHEQSAADSVFGRIH